MSHNTDYVRYCFRDLLPLLLLLFLLFMSFLFYMEQRSKISSSFTIFLFEIIVLDKNKCF
jgi:hypothetical protein